MDFDIVGMRGGEGRGRGKEERKKEKKKKKAKKNGFREKKAMLSLTKPSQAKLF